MWDRLDSAWQLPGTFLGHGTASWHRPGRSHPQAFGNLCLQRSPHPKSGVFATLFFYASGNFSNLADPNFLFFVCFGFLVRFWCGFFCWGFFVFGVFLFLCLAFCCCFWFGGVCFVWFVLFALFCLFCFVLADALCCTHQPDMIQTTVFSFSALGHQGLELLWFISHPWQ